MRAARLVVVVAVAVLGLGLLTSAALAGGKKKKTSVIYFAGNPKINNSGKVTAKGSLNTASACKVSRGMRLQALDQTGTVFATLDGADVRFERELVAVGAAAGHSPRGNELGACQGDEADRREVRLQGGHLRGGRPASRVPRRNIARG